MKLSNADKISFDDSKTCNICKREFNDKVKKVRDHDHFTGEYRQALCSKCNLRLRLNRKVLPCVFHNFKNYDNHMLCYKAIGKMKSWQLEVIANTSEKYMTMTANIFCRFK